MKRVHVLGGLLLAVSSSLAGAEVTTTKKTLTLDGARKAIAAAVAVAGRRTRPVSSRSWTTAAT